MACAGLRRNEEKSETLDERHGSREGCRLPGHHNSNNRANRKETGGPTTTNNDGDSSDLPVLQTEDNMRETVVWNGL